MTKGIPELDSLAGKFLSVADGWAGEQEWKAQQEEDVSQGGEVVDFQKTHKRCSSWPHNQQAVWPRRLFQHITDEAEVENHI